MAEIGRLKAQLRNGAGGEDKAELRKKVVTLQMRVQQIQETEEVVTNTTSLLYRSVCVVALVHHTDSMCQYTCTYTCILYERMFFDVM